MSKSTSSAISAALEDIRSGMRIVDAARKHAVIYGSLYCAAKRHGLAPKGNDLRPMEVKIREAITVQVSGCWLWTGRRPSGMTTDPTYRTPKRAAYKIMGREYKPSYLGMACGTEGCINPDHEKSERFPARNTEICELWKRSVEAKKHVTTLEKIGKKYGLTRERVRQIIEEQV